MTTCLMVSESKSSMAIILAPHGEQRHDGHPDVGYALARAGKPIEMVRIGNQSGRGHGPGECRRNHSRSAASTRVCQPAPLWRKRSKTSCERRIVMRSLVGDARVNSSSCRLQRIVVVRRPVRVAPLAEGIEAVLQRIRATA